jgi:membrane fusion protein (multidrug efflux system)
VEAETGIDVAGTAVAVARERLNAAEAAFREATANYERAAKDLERYRQLVAKDEIPRQQYDAAVAAATGAKAAVQSAEAGVAQARQSVEAAQALVTQARARKTQAEANVAAAGTGPQQVEVTRAEAGSAEASLAQKRAALEQARLNLQYTTVVAPVSGLVGQRSAEIGQNVQPGQPLFSIVPLEQVWVTALFKETQLRNMRPGQRVIIEVDAYGGREYQGRVESIGAATGGTFSLLPAQNASGNYVKVVQRIPVRIVIEGGQDPEHLLRPGMSVVPTVITQ